MADYETVVPIRRYFLVESCSLVVAVMLVIIHIHLDALQNFYCAGINFRQRQSCSVRSIWHLVTYPSEFSFLVFQVHLVAIPERDICTTGLDSRRVLRFLDTSHACKRQHRRRR